MKDMHYTIRKIAGLFILLSLAVGWWVTPWAFLFTAFVGANLLQSGFTRWCLMEDLLKKWSVASSDASGLAGGRSG